jgi:predicted nuclease of predicted toxin-antitoxin system
MPNLELWLDSNLSPILAKWMGEFTGVTFKSAYLLNFHGMSDLEVFERAKHHGHVILISKDADFGELISRLGSPPKLISIKIGNCDNRSLWNYGSGNNSRRYVALWLSWL